MNYTGMIKNYIKMNKGGVFDAGSLHKQYFIVIPYRTYLKILERLVKQGDLSVISKGVYRIIDESNIQESIEQHYISDQKGMYIGYAMYNLLDVSEHKDPHIEIYTSEITTKTKNIGIYRLKKINTMLVYNHVKIIRALECIENEFKIINVSNIGIAKTVVEAGLVYSDLSFEHILSTIKYKHSTVTHFANLLNQISIKNNCVEIFEKVYA